MAVVVGYVPTPEGRAALLSAARESRLRESRLVVIDSQRPDREGPPDQATYAKDLQQVLDELAADGIEHEVRQVAGGPEPADDLLMAAEETSAEVIVIGLRRRNPVGKLILGTNAQRVLLEAPCPVLAVKAEPASSPG